MEGNRDSPNYLGRALDVLFSEANACSVDALRLCGAVNISNTVTVGFNLHTYRHVIIIGYHYVLSQKLTYM